MKQEPSLCTRAANSLRTSVLGGALSWTVPAFLANTFSALHAQAADPATQAVTGKDATILVVLQMAGGNDGLNTVVPYANDYYHQARPRHWSCRRKRPQNQRRDRPASDAWPDSRLSTTPASWSIIQGVGYPNPEPLPFSLDRNLADGQRRRQS